MTPGIGALDRYLGTGVSRTNLGLYFQYSLSSPLVGGVGRDARYVVDRLAARRRSQVVA